MHGNGESIKLMFYDAIYRIIDKIHKKNNTHTHTHKSDIEKYHDGSGWEVNGVDFIAQ